MVDFGFLSVGKREKDVFKGILSLLNTVSMTVDSFEASVLALANGDAASAEAGVKKVLDGETKADEVHRGLSLKIAEGAFFGGVREDILNLMEEIDNIADSAKDAARFISSDTRLGVEGKSVLGNPEMRLFLQSLKKAVSALTDLVKALEVGKQAALGKVHTVEEFEEEADSHKDALLKAIFSEDQTLHPVTIIQLRDFLFVADDIADNAEDASDVILILISKGYG